MKIIPKAEVLSLEDQEIRYLLITAFREEHVSFPEYTDPAWDRKIPPRDFLALRIEISEENDRPRARHYWIDSKRLIGVLLPLLKQPAGTPRLYKIKKFGLPPASHYTVDVI